MPAPAVHHIALVCKDAEATHHFYNEVLGFPLAHAELQTRGRSFVKHFFYDVGDGSCIAFFQLHQAGEPEQYDTAISTGLGLPVWVNHIALRRERDQLEEIKGRVAAAGVTPTMELDHGWCTSVYYTDPNGNLIEFCADTPGMPAEGEEAALRVLRAVPEPAKAAKT